MHARIQRALLPLSLTGLLCGAALGQGFCDNLPDDEYEPNDSPLEATVVGNDYLTPFVSMTSPDYYRTCVPAGGTVTFEIEFTDFVVELDLFLFDAATMNPLSTNLNIGCCTVETHTYTNTGSETQDVICLVEVRDLIEDCGFYEMWVSGSDCGEFDDTFCYGDGGDQMGCTDCPCGNNAPAGFTGGCLNSSGNGAELFAAGSTSLSTFNLAFTMTGGTPISFGALTSGQSRAPASPVNPCFGLDSGISQPIIDGLRCAVQGILRHGTRAIDGTGSTVNPWGPSSPSWPNAAFVAGQIRHFQVVYREMPALGCGTALNTSQGMTLTFRP